MSKFSFQLYSARNYPPMDDVLANVARLGYAQVEGFGGLYADAAGLAASMKKYGLTMPTGHFGLTQLQDTSTAMKWAETLGVKTLICPAIPKEERSQGEDKWIQLGETLGELNETYRKAGFGFGWHNHNFEFAPTDSGRLPMEIILEVAAGIDWEVDVAWLVVGKQDVSAWFDKYGTRITALHVKDIAPAGEAVDEDGWADVGHGTLNWPQIMAAAKAKTKARYFVMEHDNPSDVNRFASRSIAAAKQWA
ncbi:MAG TPA: sugar phosphate isomerase/epimerase [Devosiaceae bacterium]|jgi:sugar phosphate isomerase/epimerase